VVFIEVLRLVLVLLGALTGAEIGRSLGSSTAQLIGAILGVLAGYLIGGLVGRLVTRHQGRALARFERIPPGELFAGTLTAIAGLLLGGALCLPLLVVIRDPIAYMIVSVVAWVFAWVGFRIGVAKGRQIVAAAGLTRILAPPTEPPPGYALLVDASSIMDRQLFVLGRAGLLVGGIVIPRFVIDQLQTLTAGPDPVSSRRARRGLEMVEVLRDKNITVHVAENELPDVDHPDDRLIEISRRLGLRIATCSTGVVNRAKRLGIPVTDLRHLVTDLTPNIPPGDKLVIDLVKEGNQPRQAVGYLPDGDMVVVNDASHLVGREDVVVEVLMSRPTSQGLLVFAKLVDRPPATPAELLSAVATDHTEPVLDSNGTGPRPADTEDIEREKRAPDPRRPAPTGRKPEESPATNRS
jgi:uncharacterized protein YacL